MAFKNIINLSVAPIGRRIRDVWNMQTAEWLDPEMVARNRFLGHFLKILLRFLQDIGSNAAIKKIKTGYMVFTSQ